MGSGPGSSRESSRDEPIWVVIHMCMVTLGISLYSYRYPKLAKTLCLSYYRLCFLFNKVREEERGIGSAWKLGGWGGSGPNHVYKCK
jgi:hypothetical protein